MHEPFDLAAIQPTNMHIVDATTCTYEFSRTPPGKGFIVLDVRKNTTYKVFFHSRIALEVRITLANGDDCPSDGGVNLIPGNNFAHSLFSSRTLELNGMVVSNTTSYTEHAYL